MQNFVHIKCKQLLRKFQKQFLNQIFLLHNKQAYKPMTMTSHEYYKIKQSLKNNNTCPAVSNISSNAGSPSMTACC